MILYNTEAGRIKQRILCCRKFIVIFGSSDLFIKQLLALAAESAECRLLKFSFRAWQKYWEGILINISSKKNAFVRVFTLTILWLSAILKLDFLRSPGKSGSARPLRGMKLGTLHRMALVSVWLFCKNLGNLQEFFGQMVYRPPWQKIARTPMVHILVWMLPQDISDLIRIANDTTHVLMSCVSPASRYESIKDHIFSKLLKQ